MSPSTDEKCIECGQRLDETIYALYSTPSKENHEVEKDEVIAHLCAACSKKKKVKPIRGRNDLHKLKDLFNSQEP